MPQRLPDRPGISAGLGNVQVGAPVRSLNAQDFAQLTMWLAGYGAQLIPPHAPLSDQIGNESIFRYRVTPRFQALQRRWYFRLRGEARGEATIKIPSTAPGVVVSVGTTPENTLVHQVTEDLSSQSSTETEIDFAVEDTGASSSAPVIEMVQCWEVPRVSLVANSSDLGVDTSKLRPDQPIKRGSIDNAILVAEDASLVGHRNSAFQWAAPATINGSTSTSHVIQVTSTSFVDVFAGDGLPILQRKYARGDFTSQQNAKVYAWVSSGSGSVRLVSALNGNGNTVSITATSPAWSDLLSVTVDAEDLSASDGRQGSVTDYVQLEALKVTSGTLFIASFSGLSEEPL